METVEATEGLLILARIIARDLVSRSLSELTLETSQKNVCRDPPFSSPQLTVSNQPKTKGVKQ